MEVSPLENKKDEVKSRRVALYHSPTWYGRFGNLRGIKSQEEIFLMFSQGSRLLIYKAPKGASGTFGTTVFDKEVKMKENSRVVGFDFVIFDDELFCYLLLTERLDVYHVENAKLSYSSDFRKDPPIRIFHKTWILTQKGSLWKIGKKLHKEDTGVPNLLWIDSKTPKIRYKQDKRTVSDEKGKTILTHSEDIRSFHVLQTSPNPHFLLNFTHLYSMEGKLTSSVYLKTSYCEQIGPCQMLMYGRRWVYLMSNAGKEWIVDGKWILRENFVCVGACEIEKAVYMSFYDVPQIVSVKIGEEEEENEEDEDEDDDEEDEEGEESEGEGESGSDEK